MARKNARAVNGILLLDKPLEVSSNGILQRVRWLYQAQKAGHTGALDPMASGLLPICFGEATKFSQFLLDTDKTYLVTASFGVRTSTSDSEGEVISERPVSFTDTDLEQALQSFRGDIMQVPTMFSALKYQGQPLYKYARQGITIEREARPITIFKFELLQRRGNQADFIVHCSKGTYIRTLIDDLGELLGCGGHVSKLHRTQVGPFTASQMVKPVQLDAMAEQCHSTADFGPLDALLLPLDAGIVAMPAIALSKDQQHQLQHGQNCNVVADDIAAIKLLGPAEVFIGIGQIQQGVLSSRRLLNTSAVQQPATVINAL
ncbi:MULTISPECIES: tRNA pseudouridine(55) synthase TruB [unclassified Arsukibacterium]|uniref:tRNA pseudouridine(55) synthase TruB n=1 Tax=unclassified Arsukibacterium TaxID=2635278 RepID=UPI000C65389C|nr:MULTISPECIES: tRNA pseudouridine(55) synthase TruB [unclassified Arsukibacterium]MAA93431.1 tRNA pseudouridine(55) synthase TruB [Rheinheimera sp.]MBM34497.1 tRNA pseudouridine(55) synthase TruB [Rheinheimera sp.]HAW93045.1 tRNA pseudouridine(55) synthase TruB [Candidatus Azambacteria bacterium]|tara:strand:+ start:1231 stop:2184 length:954 start_codon:yes stop_codon:yes gene_type:complete